MRRRELLSLGLAAPLLSACGPVEKLLRWNVPVQIYRPGMSEGHWLRDHRKLPPATATRKADTVIVGSGIAGLSAAWKLKREGYNDFLLLAGPELAGNAAAGQNRELRFPLGAHYLPLPTQESTHVREMLADFGVLQGAANAGHPEYDERYILHSPDERLFINGHWQEGIVPVHGLDATALEQQRRFFHYTDSLKKTLGGDGRRAFTLPLALCSADEEWRALDRLSFAAWLKREGYTAPSLLWYLDYCCRDDYGASPAQVSAWAGLHYFACRSGQARNAEDGAVLTWPDGLNFLAGRLHAPALANTVKGFAIAVRPQGNMQEVLYADGTGAHAQIVSVQARRVIIATPLHVAAHLLPLRELGFDPEQHMPPHAPWMVSNFVMRDYPHEPADIPLSWDNVVYQGRGLGYVNATHQLIRTAKPERTAFTAYQALSSRPPVETRRWLAQATQDELINEAACDLTAAYGPGFWRDVQSLHITLRGHAMASPTPGFLGNAGLLALRNSDQGLLFAHSDLSGLSVFEEASWWGWQAASRILAG